MWWTIMIVSQQILEIPVEDGSLGGILTNPADSQAVILFAHGSGSGRLSPRNQFVANHLNQNGFSTLLFDLLTSKEESIDAQTGHLRFDIELLAARLVLATDWLREHFRLYEYPFGYFGASTGAGAALVAATKRPYLIKAVVSRGGRPDLAEGSLAFVQAPTLLIVGENDPQVIDLNRQALQQLFVPKKEIQIVPAASHLFEEPGALEKVAQLAVEWFEDHMLDNKNKGGRHGYRQSH
jgi:putative phosphoribosyl transferase